MRKETKTAQLQIRVSAEEKRLIAQAARRAGLDMSSYVLGRVLGVNETRMRDAMRPIAVEATRSYGYAELNDLLMSLGAAELRRAVASRPFDDLPPEAANYVAAMVEQACARAGVEVPAWTRKIRPLDTPLFGSQLGSLRLHLLASSPAPFKRRNVFIDTSLGGRVQRRVLSEKDIRRLLGLLDAELRKAGVNGELCLVGGAVMCLAFQARPATRDVDAFFVPAARVREAAVAVARKSGFEADWLNDAVKGYLSEQGEFAPFLELGNLKVLVAQPEYLLAMKCLAMRIGEEFHDEDDIRYLLRHLNISTYAAATKVITRFYPLERFPQKTLYALQELLGHSEPS